MAALYSIEEIAAMVTADDFVIESIQVSGFTQGDTQLRPSNAVQRATRRWGDIYNAQVVSLPLPPEAPLEVPSVIMSSEDGSLKMEIARSRINLFWQSQGNQPPSVREITRQFVQRLVFLFRSDGVPIGRLGLVIVRAATVEAPAIALARHYFRDEWLKAPLNRPENLEIHAHKTYEMRPGFRVNSWVRVRTGKRVVTGAGVIAVEQDLNTLEEERATRGFDASSVRRFFSAAASESDSILRLYFPSRPPGKG
jgi:hypothetical protein